MNIMPELKGKSGIYQIRNLENGKVYVGSSVELRNRAWGHRFLLNTQQHYSKDLQEDWSRLSEAAFVFEVLELAPREQLVEREQFWIDWYDASNSGYNMCPTAGNLLGYKATREAKQNISQSLKRFYSTEEGQNLASRRAKGKSKKGRGAANENHHKALSYSLTSPDGMKYEGKNVHHFARQMGLNGSCLASLVKGEIRCYKGWIVTGNESCFERPRAKYQLFQFRSPDGTIHIGRGVSAFANHHGLSRGCMAAVYSGRVSQHRGWTKSELSEEELANHKVIYFSANSPND